MGKSRSTTTATNLDPKSQAFIDSQRAQARGAAGMAQNHPGNFFLGPNQQSIGEQISPFMNPFQDQVIDSTRAEFDRMRGQATLGVNEAVTRSGGFGGSRHGVAEGQRLGEIDAAQGSTIAGLNAQNFSQGLQFGLPYAQQQHQLAQQQAMEPLWRQQQAQGFFNNGLGETGQTTTQTEQGSTMGTIAGLGMAGAGMMMGNPRPALGVLGGGGGQDNGAIGLQRHANQQPKHPIFSNQWQPPQFGSGYR